MTASASVRPIVENDIAETARFLHAELNSNVSASAWERLLRPPWDVEAPNRGFALHDADGIVGVYVAVYSRRQVGEQSVDVCNLAAFCVREDYRAHGLRLVRALLAQKGFVFTDLSPSGNVVALNERLGFRMVPGPTVLAVNAPATPARGIRLLEDADAIAAVLTGVDARFHHDHRSTAAARHLVVQAADSWAYLVFRRERRKRLPLFAAVLYAGGDRALLQRAWPTVRGRLLRRGMPFTLIEPRVLGFTPRAGRVLSNPRVRMVRGDGLPAEQVDGLYSELALVQW